MLKCDARISVKQKVFCVSADVSKDYAIIEKVVAQVMVLYCQNTIILLLVLPLLT